MYFTNTTSEDNLSPYASGYNLTQKCLHTVLIQFYDLPCRFLELLTRKEHAVPPRQIKTALHKLEKDKIQFNCTKSSNPNTFSSIFKLFLWSNFFVWFLGRISMARRCTQISSFTPITMSLLQTQRSPTPCPKEFTHYVPTNMGVRRTISYKLLWRLKKKGFKYCCLHQSIYFKALC